MRDGFLFLGSFYEAIKDLEDDLRHKCQDAILDYGITGIEPQIEDPVVNAIFILVKPIIDKNYQRYLNGKKGGRPKKNSGDSEQANEPAPDSKEAKDNSEKLKKTKKEKQPERTAFGVYKNVKLSSEEYQELVISKGEQLTQDAILFLDSYIESLSPQKKKDYKSRNHKIAMLQWVYDRVEQKQKNGKVVNYKTNNFAGFIQEERPPEYYTDLERQIIDN